MWSDAALWSFLIAESWRASLQAFATFFGWRQTPPRITVPPMSREWLQELEASRRPGDL